MLKTEKSTTIRMARFVLYTLFFILIIMDPISPLAKGPEPSKKSALEEEVLKALKNIQCRKTEIQIVSVKEKVSTLKTLAVKFEGIKLGQMVADYMTILYEDPVIDLIKLKSQDLNIASYSKNRVSILISAGAIEGYFANKAKEVKKRFNKVSIKFSPPYIECFFDVPASEISPETLKLLDKFIKSGKLEGYAAFQFKVKNNDLFALSSKVIVNHFLVPDLILRELQTKFNPFDGIPVVKPFQYSMNTVTVQNRYIYITN